MPSGIFPFILVLYTVYNLIFPLRTRGPMWKSIWSVAMAPSTSPSFYHGYVGDIFTSMVKVFQDIAWTICFMFSGDWLIDEDLKESTRHPWAHAFWYKNILIPIICLLPLVFRFNQCLRKFHDTGKRFPHLANASKYALSQTVTLFGAFHPLYLMHKNPESHTVNLFQFFWTGVFVASSLYSFTWDVYMDWGLGIPKHQFLGPRLMYPRRIYYYYIIALDLGELMGFTHIHGRPLSTSSCLFYNDLNSASLHVGSDPHSTAIGCQI
jgi:xenotropic and polytropic retrovirus receptor 1